VPAEDPGVAGATLLGAGEKFQALGRGVASTFGADVAPQAWDEQARMAGVREQYPVAHAIGGMLPTLATARFGAPGYLANLGIQAGLGGLEGALTYDPRASGTQRAVAGAAGGVLGDSLGRVMGRAYRMTRGLMDDIAGRGVPANPAAFEWEQLGGRTLAYQRMQQGTKAQRMAERAMQGAEASINPPAILAETAAHTSGLFREGVARAVGLDPVKYENLGPEFIDDALNRFGAEFDRFAGEAAGVNPFALDADMARKLSRSRQVRDLMDLGEFPGLTSKRPSLSGPEWVTARQALAEDAANAFNRGDGEYGKRIQGMVDYLDGAMQRRLGPDRLAEFARLREQYRVFKVLEKPNVINAEGAVNVRSLNRAMRAQTAFGRTATRGAPAGNAETTQLMQLARAADRPEFKALRTSGTAENVQLGQMAEGAGEAASALVGGDLVPLASLLGRVLAPVGVGLSQMGGGRLFEGAFTPAPASMVQGGAYLGRSLLDESLYPYVGAEDERRPQ